MLDWKDFVQVAGVIDGEEANLLITCGVRCLAFPLRLPVHTEDLTEAAVAEIVAALPDNVHAILVTYLDEADEIATFCRELDVRVVQLHGDVSPEELARLDRIEPGLTIVKSLVVGLHTAKDLERVVSETSPYVDAFITDTFDADTGASGATGLTHDWTISRRLVEFSPRPVILAGGLTAENVQAAIEFVRPAGVDVHTGVEEETGRKSRTRVERFIAAAKAGFESLR